MQKTIKKSSKIHIRRGDLVKVLAGKHKNEQGVVLKVFPKEYRALVKGMNMISKHIKPSAENPKGAIEKKEAPIHISNLMFVVADTGQATRVGRKLNEEGRLQRYAKKTGNFIK
ncbi:50S ribosomal protein L24 [Cardinium endosymbiont of Culicoides punctatus]|uniref:50S ribosomal protein L24 n=1 Tax=Cardinium endosymbiont of Culicoides punctatus TaxID=2304601 RepID=UPI001058460C|nr:50S ribosomal protein L24 [Cardinium endosymbiont of Culicoides punctatus]TDG95315.1 50S ribosomal protein L24 [Cardinium endosymbiont of Culicoides punctatus]